MFRFFGVSTVKTAVLDGVLPGSAVTHVGVLERKALTSAVVYYEIDVGKPLVFEEAFLFLWNLDDWEAMEMALCWSNAVFRKPLLEYSCLRLAALLPMISKSSSWRPLEISLSMRRHSLLTSLSLSCKKWMMCLGTLMSRQALILSELPV